MINPQVNSIITNYINSFFSKTEIASVQDLTSNFNGPSSILESEIRFAINQSIDQGYLKVIRKKYSEDLELLQLIRPIDNFIENTFATVVISRPRLRELGFLSVEKRNLFLETTECFKILINSSKKILRICSPFLKQDILSLDSFPELDKLLSNAIDRGVEIRILTRDIKNRGLKEIEWLQQLDKNNREKKLKIADYHFLSNKSILSSTHAKIICSDYESAYIGSAELRRNSIVTNFEIGCHLEGPQVYGICEAFDLMFNKGEVWRA